MVAADKRAVPRGSFAPPGIDAPRKPRARELRQLSDMMSRLADEADQIPRRSIPAVLAVVDDALRETRAALRALVREMPHGELRYTAQHHRVVVIQLAEIRRILGEKLPAEMAAAILGGADEQMALALDHLRDEAARFAVVFGDTIAPVNLRRVEAVTSARSMVIPRIRSSSLRYGQTLLGWQEKGMRLSQAGWTEQIQAELAKGMLRRESFHQITNRLVKIGGPLAEIGPESMNFRVIEQIPEGLFRRYRHRAEMVVRTELLNAANVVKLEGLKEWNEEDPGVMKRWDATADRRLCPVCGPLDGEVRDVDKPFTGGYQHPPGHPNCRCVTTPWRKEWGEESPAARTVDRELKQGAA